MEPLYYIHLMSHSLSGPQWSLIFSEVWFKLFSSYKPLAKVLFWLFTFKKVPKSCVSDQKYRLLEALIKPKEVQIVNSSRHYIIH